MPYKIDIPPKVRKSLDDLDNKTFEYLKPAIDDLVYTPRPVTCKKLGGSTYRIRKGNWRIIYAVFDKEKIVQLIRIVRRGERTYKDIF